MRSAVRLHISVMPSHPGAGTGRALAHAAGAPVRRAGALAHAALLRSGGITRAVPGFEATPFRLTGSDIIWVSHDGPDHPRVVLIDGAATDDVLALHAGTQMSICAPSETLGGCAFPADAARTSASRAILRLMHRSIPRGFAGLLNRQTLPFPLSHRADSAHALAHACAEDNSEAFVHHAQHLLGVGSGLTPSGDDFVGGALFALGLIHVRNAAPAVNAAVDATPDITFTTSHRAEPDEARAARWQRAATHIVTHAASRTHVISAALLADLARGQSYAALHAFAAAITRSDADAAFTHATALTSIGASSGWDMLAGFMAALRGNADTLTLPLVLPLARPPAIDTHTTPHRLHRHA